jgi:hypothetical protein
MQEVNPLADDELLGEANVRWTCGKWRDAMQIYEWWIGNHGTGSGNEVARKYLDCAAKAMDFEAFCRMMEKLIDQKVDQTFLQDMAAFGLMRDPGNFDLMGIAEAVDAEERKGCSRQNRSKPTSGTGCPLQEQATGLISSIFTRLQSADLSLLAKKLREKERSEPSAFPGAPLPALQAATGANPVHDVPNNAETLVKHTLERHHLDAERAFAHTLPVGQPTPAGVNPGVLYKAFRAKENPAHRSKEVNLLFGQANKIAESLARSSSDLLRETESRATRCRDSDPRIKRQRQSVLQMAWNYPMAIVSLSANLQGARAQTDSGYLRKARFFLLRADLAWPSFVRRMHDTPEHPVNAWCARLKELQRMAETIRRGI